MIGALRPPLYDCRTRWHSQRANRHTHAVNDTVPKTTYGSLCPADAQQNSECDPPDLNSLPLPIQPPWATLVWKQELPPRAIVKLIVRPPDITVTGRIFDLFV